MCVLVCLTTNRARRPKSGVAQQAPTGPNAERQIAVTRPFRVMPSQCDLAELWNSAPDGRLSPLQQMRVLALRDAQKDLGDGNVNCAWIAERVTLSGPGRHHPGRDAVRLLLERIDGDSDWFPGKSYQTRFGPTPLLTPRKRKAMPLP